MVPHALAWQPLLPDGWRRLPSSGEDHVAVLVSPAGLAAAEAWKIEVNRGDDVGAIYRAAAAAVQARAASVSAITGEATLPILVASGPTPPRAVIGEVVLTTPADLRQVLGSRPTLRIGWQRAQRAQRAARALVPVEPLPSR